MEPQEDGASARPHWRGAAPTWLFAGIFGTTGVAHAVHFGVSSWKDAGVLTFFATQAVFFALLSAQMLRPKLAASAAPFIVSGAGEIVAGILVLAGILSGQLRALWWLAVFLALKKGSFSIIVARRTSKCPTDIEQDERARR